MVACKRIDRRLRVGAALIVGDHEVARAAVDQSVGRMDARERVRVATVGRVRLAVVGLVGSRESLRPSDGRKQAAERRYS